MTNPVIVARALLGIASVPVFCTTSYLALLSALSASPRPPEPGRPHLRFDIVVPAHDEAGGIEATLRSLLALDYPTSLFQVFVVADNCSDDTAARARALGVQVIERVDPAHRGKGYALTHAFEDRLAAGEADAVVVVDADTVVSPNLLQAFAARIEAGASAMQASYGVRDPGASFRTLVLSVAFSAYHAVRSLGRERMGLSSGLRGNGMCFTTALLEAVPHEATSLVEDVEYGLRLGEEGYRVEYVHEARVLGDMASGPQAAEVQRRRWEGGRAALLRTRALPLLAKAITRRDPVLADLAIDLLVPPLATVVAAATLGLVLSGGLFLLSGGLPIATLIWASALVEVGVYVFRGWQLSGTGSKGLFAMCSAPAYLCWKLTLSLKRATHATGEWVRTPRTGEAS